MVQTIEAALGMCCGGRQALRGEFRQAGVQLFRTADLHHFALHTSDTHARVLRLKQCSLCSPPQHDCGAPFWLSSSGGLSASGPCPFSHMTQHQLTVADITCEKDETSHGSWSGSDMREECWVILCRHMLGFTTRRRSWVWTWSSMRQPRLA